MSLNLNVSDISLLESAYAFLAGISQNISILLSIRRNISFVLFFPNISNVNLDLLFKVVSTRFLHSKITDPYVINTFLGEGILCFKYSVSHQVFNPLVLVFTGDFLILSFFFLYLWVATLLKEELFLLIQLFTCILFILSCTNGFLLCNLFLPSF